MPCWPPIILIACHAPWGLLVFWLDTLLDVMQRMCSLAECASHQHACGAAGCERPLATAVHTLPTSHSSRACNRPPSCYCMGHVGHRLPWACCFSQQAGRQRQDWGDSGWGVPLELRDSGECLLHGIMAATWRCWPLCAQYFAALSTERCMHADIMLISSMIIQCDKILPRSLSTISEMTWLDMYSCSELANLHSCAHVQLCSWTRLTIYMYHMIYYMIWWSCIWPDVWS